MFIPSVLIIEKMGMKVALLASIAASVIGAWIALASNDKPIQIVGQLIIDCGFPLVASAVTKVPAQWFPYKERFYATSVGVLAGMIGYTLGDATQAIFGIGHPIGFAIFLTIIGGILVALLLTVYQDNPINPPSLSQAQKEGSHLELLGDIKILLKDGGFMLCLISVSLFICYTVDVSKGLANIIKLGDVLIQDIEGITIFFYIPGLFSCLLPAVYLSRGVMMYRTTFLVILLVSFITLGFLVIAIAYASDSAMFLYISTIVNGFVTSMAMPLSYEIVTEQGFPFSEVLTAGAVHALYAVFRLILKGMNRILDADNSGIQSFAYCFVLIVLVFLSFVLMFFAKMKHRRLKVELKANR